MSEQGEAVSERCIDCERSTSGRCWQHGGTLTDTLCPPPGAYTESLRISYSPPRPEMASIPAAELSALRAVAEAARLLEETCVMHEVWQTDPAYLRWNERLVKLRKALKRSAALSPPVAAHEATPPVDERAPLVGASCYCCVHYVYASGLCRLADADACQVATCPHWEGAHSR